jgi:hypothetical protein
MEKRKKAPRTRHPQNLKENIKVSSRALRTGRPSSYEWEQRSRRPKRFLVRASAKKVLDQPDLLEDDGLPRPGLRQLFLDGRFGLTHGQSGLLYVF